MTEANSGIAADADSVGALIDAWRWMVGRLPGATSDESDDVASFFGHVPLAFLNMSMLSRPMTEAKDFERAIGVAAERARACAFASFTGLCRAWAPPEADAIIADTGLALAMTVTGMATDALAPPRRPPPALSYRLTTDPAAARDLGRVNAFAYGMPVEDLAVTAEPALWTGQSFGVVGDVEGEAVSSAWAFVVGGVIYVAYVATLPSAYGHGYAEAVMRRAIALAQAAGGPRRIWLHATDMGAPLYRSMGFVAGAPLPLFSLARPPATPGPGS